MKFRLTNPGHVSIVILYVAIVSISLVFAWLLRFDFAIPPAQTRLLSWGLALALPIKIASFLLGRLHRPMWRFAAAGDLLQLLAVNVIASVGFAAGSVLVLGPGVPSSIFLIDFLVCLLLTAASRFAPQIYSDAIGSSYSKYGGKGVLVYGAGVAGAMLVREIRNNPRLDYNLIGFLDDDLSKRDATLMGVPVLGTGRDVAQIVERYATSPCSVQEIIIAIPSANTNQMREVLANCRAVGVPCKTIPSHGELISGRIRNGPSHNLSLDDLLGREPVELNEDSISTRITGRTILVTGAAGSIGSELCRQIARFAPKRLIAFDQAESELFKLDLELQKNFPALNLQIEIGDIRDEQRMRALMAREPVDSVFHAAAYKHVPMMESHVLEAVKNNILGTWNVVQGACEKQVSDFLMISTDKAVRPSSVMGATKRVAELIASAMPPNGVQGRTKFVSVRFGNVLGSNGSVVPIFQAQIAAGGPVTVTHPEAHRYFMTTREAVQLILQASTMGKGSEIFVLDMGEAVRITDLARNMIQLSGFVPNQDIEIRYVGLRPGEKIYEELITEGEDILPTYHEKIKIFQGPRLSLDTIEAWIAKLKVLVEQGDELEVVAHISQLVPEYRPARKLPRGEKLAPILAAGSAKGVMRSNKKRAASAGAGLVAPRIPRTGELL